jgi:RNA polymerase sigma-32 factor
MAVSSEGGALAAYRSQLSSFSPLSEDKERELALAWRAGDKRAGDRLVCACLPFVVSVAMEYRRWGVPLEDVIQQGNIGLLRAAERFDPSKQCRLITYAAYWVRAEIRDYVVRAYRVVRFGTTKSERRALRLYRTTREDDPAALAAASGLTEAQAERLLPLLASRDLSLDVESSSHGGTGVERLPAPGPSPEDLAGASERGARARAELAAALAELSPRERLIVEERWAGEDPVTLEHLGRRLGVSKERVRQIEERTRAKLRARLASFERAADAA